MKLLFALSISNRSPLAARRHRQQQQQQRAPSDNCVLVVKKRKAQNENGTSEFVFSFHSIGKNEPNPTATASASAEPPDRRTTPTTPTHHRQLTPLRSAQLTMTPIFVLIIIRLDSCVRASKPSVAVVLAARSIEDENARRSIIISNSACVCTKALLEVRQIINSAERKTPLSLSLSRTSLLGKFSPQVGGC